MCPFLFYSAEVEEKVAASLSTSQENVLAVKSDSTVECDTVKIYFLGKFQSTESTKHIHVDKIRVYRDDSYHYRFNK